MKMNARTIASAAVVGAAYTALTMLLAPISFGPVQLRVAEALCVLPAFMPATTWGLWVGCALANLLGGYGIPDIVFGSAATLFSGLCISAVSGGKAEVPSWLRSIIICLIPAAFNGPIVGAVISYGSGFPLGWSWPMTMLQVALEEAAVMLLLGLPLLRLLPRSKPLMRYMRGEVGENVGRA